MPNTFHNGTVTYAERGIQSTIRLCWITLGLLDRLMKSEVDRGLDHDTDHLPITTIVDPSVKDEESEAQRGWRRSEDKKLGDVHRQTLPQRQRLRTKTALDRYVKMLVDAIDRGVEKVMPKAWQLPKAKKRAGKLSALKHWQNRKDYAGCTVLTTPKNLGKSVVKRGM